MERAHESEQAFLARAAEEIRERHRDPFSEASDWLTPEQLAVLLDELAAQAGRGGVTEPTRVEVETRIAMHVATKQLQAQRLVVEQTKAALELQREVGVQARTDAARLIWATRWLVLATVGLFCATAVLVWVTWKHGF